MKDFFLVALAVLKKIVILLEGHMCAFLASLLPPIASQIMSKDAQVRDAIHDVLMEIQIHCGSDGLRIIKAKVPTYSQMF